jgi:hypothetical protein
MSMDIEENNESISSSLRKEIAAALSALRGDLQRHYATIRGRLAVL